MREKSVWLCGLVIALAALPQQAHASGTLGEAVAELVGDVKLFLDSQGKNKVSIGQFSGRDNETRNSSAGRLLQWTLEHRLKASGIAIVAAKADYEVICEFEACEDTNTQRQFLRFLVELRGPDGTSTFFRGNQLINGQQTQVKYYIKNEADLAKLIGPSSLSLPLSEEKARIAAFKKAIDRPEALIDGTRALAAKGAPFAVEILTAPAKKDGGGLVKLDDFKACQPTAKKGLGFVPIDQNDVFAIRVTNNADFDVAIDVCIDGISMFQRSQIKAAKTDLPAYKLVIVPKKSTAVLRGWFIKPQQLEAFAASPNGGTITALFYAAWPEDNVSGGRPKDEPKNPDDYSMCPCRANKGILVNTEFQVVDYAIGVLRAAVSLRYAK